MSTRYGPPLWERWARFRYSVVAPLLSSPVAPGELQEALKALAEKEYLHPLRPGLHVRFSKASIERWYYLARKARDPIAALGRKVRSDLGSERVMKPELVAALEAQYRQHTRWSCQLHWDNLVALAREKPELGPVPSYATVCRRMKSRGWVPLRGLPRNPTRGQVEAKERLEKREVRSFEREHPLALLHSDFHHGSRKVVDSAGAWHKAILLAILDDCSRVCCHAQWYLSETAEVFIHGVCQAFAKRGLPREFMTDRGAAMLAQETVNGLARLGVLHKPTLGYSPYQNAKSEVFWAQVEGRLLPMLESVHPLTLKLLNDATQAWVELEYNRKKHDELGCSPLERLLERVSVARPAPDAETMRLAFTIQEQRMQRRSDGTVSILGVRFEVPSRFRHQLRLSVKYQSFDLSRTWLVDGHTGEVLCRILPLDKTANADGRRRSLEPTPSVDSAPAAGGEPIPPLMRQLLREYERGGLPPAYIPIRPEEMEADHE